jgi:hypothetical protein
MVVFPTLPDRTTIITDSIMEALREVSTATLTTLMLKHGLRNVWLRGVRPLASGQKRVVGRAFHPRA